MQRTIQPVSNSPFRVTLGPALLYLDDVQDVCKGLAKLADDIARGDSNRGGKRWRRIKLLNDQPLAESDLVEIRAQNAIAASVADLQDATRAELDHLTLVLQSPKIRIDFRCQSSEVIAESDDEVVRTFVRGLEDFIKGRRSWWALAYVSFTRGWPYLLLGFSYFALMLPVIPASLRMQPGLFSYVLAGIVSAGILIVIYMQYRRVVRVLPFWRKDGRRLSDQTRRQILIVLTSSGIAGLLGLWAGLFVHK